MTTLCLAFTTLSNLDICCKDRVRKEVRGYRARANKLKILEGGTCLKNSNSDCTQPASTIDYRKIQRASTIVAFR